MWAALNASQRVILSVSATAMVLLLVWGSASTVPTMVRVAGAEVDAAKRQEILSKFQQHGQKHEVRGTEILVPKEDADRVVMELAGEGTMSNNAVWKFLEQSDIFATRWQMEKRMQIALQARLEGMIRSIESVKNASVVINPGSTSYAFGFAGSKPSASVQVELQEGKSLNRKNVQAIAGLVARAVNGVEDDQVHIMDTKGISYRATRNDSQDIALEVEQLIQKQLKDTFAFSGASVIVRVQTKATSSKSEEMKYGRSQVKESEESITRKGGPATSSPRVLKGSPEPESPAEAPVPPESQSTNKELRVLDQKKITEDNPAGQVERITVGVLIPIEVGPDGKEMTEAEKLLPKLKEFVLKGSQARSEDVSVQFIPTRRPEPIAANAPSEGPLVWLGLHASKIAMFGLALAGLFVLLRVVQTAMARDTVEEIQSLTNALTETQEAGVDLAGPAAGDLGRLKQSVQDMVGRNPESVAASLKSFMSGR